jgi:hypothetical protein
VGSTAAHPATTTSAATPSHAAVFIPAHRHRLSRHYGQHVGSTQTAHSGQQTQGLRRASAPGWGRAGHEGAGFLGVASRHVDTEGVADRGLYRRPLGREGLPNRVPRLPELQRVFSAATRRGPDSAGHHRTDQDRPPDLLVLVRGPIGLVWRVQDSNLGRLSRWIYSPYRRLLEEHRTGATGRGRWLLRALG